MRFTVCETCTHMPYQLAVRSSETVHALKTRLQVKVGIPVERMRVSFGNKTLEDRCTLFECGVRSESTVVLSPTGLTFTVKTETGTEHEVHMSSSDLVQGLELKLQEITQCPTDRQKLMFNGRRLEHKRPLSAYGIQQASVVHMMIHKPNNITVIVKTVTGKSFYIDLDLCDTVENLKVKIQDKEGIPVDQMQLIFAGEQLEDKRTVSDCGIKHLNIVHLMLRLCGGNDVNETVKMETGLTFTVKTEMGTKHKVHMRSLDCVKMLKLILQEMIQCPINQQKLMFNGRQLEDDHPLSAYGIQQASVVHMMIRNINDMVVRVRLHTRKTLDIDLDVCDTVENLKVKIQDKEGISVFYVGLVYAGQRLEDERTVSDYGVKHLSIVEFLFTARGGGCMETIGDDEDEDDKDAGENRGRRMSMEELADFNHEKPWSCQIS